MKLMSLFVAVATMAMLAGAVYAQRPDRRRPQGENPRPEGRQGRFAPREGFGRFGGPGGPGARFRNPIVTALDADEDGEISAEEIKNASAALAKLDKNKDGKLTMDELRPSFGGQAGPEGRNAEGAPQGRGSRFGPRGGQGGPRFGPRGGPRGEGAEGDRPRRPQRPEA